MSKEFSIYISYAEDTSIIEFELLKASTRDYWEYTATRYTGTGIDLAEYHIRADRGNAHIGTVRAVFDPKYGISWEYGDAGMEEGRAPTFEKALLKLTKKRIAR